MADFSAVIDLSSLDGTTGFRIDGEAERDFSGFSVSSAGDINGDGLGDLVIGAPFANPNITTTGASYVVFGRANGFERTLPLSSLNGSNGFEITGENAG